MCKYLPSTTSSVSIEADTEIEVMDGSDPPPPPRIPPNATWKRSKRNRIAAHHSSAVVRMLLQDIPYYADTCVWLRARARVCVCVCVYVYFFLVFCRRSVVTTFDTGERASETFLDPARVFSLFPSLLSRSLSLSLSLLSVSLRGASIHHIQCLITK